MDERLTNELSRRLGRLVRLGPAIDRRGGGSGGGGAGIREISSALVFAFWWPAESENLDGPGRALAPSSLRLDRANAEFVGDAAARLETVVKCKSRARCGLLGRGERQ